MNVKKLLESHKIIDDKINTRLEEVAQLRALAERVTTRIEQYSTHEVGTHSDKVGKYAPRIVDLENRIDHDIDRLVNLKERIMDIASSLDDDTERIVIERHYILHESFTDIADKLCYSIRHITRIHTRAIANLEKIYNKED